MTNAFLFKEENDPFASTLGPTFYNVHIEYMCNFVFRKKNS